MTMSCVFNKYSCHTLLCGKDVIATPIDIKDRKGVKERLCCMLL